MSDIPFDEPMDVPPRQLVAVREHPVDEVSQRCHREEQRSNNDNDISNKTSYLGTRRDRSGRWIRRHCSEKRFPRMAGKANAASSLQSPTEEETKNAELVDEDKHKGRLSSPRRQRQLHKEQQQQRQQKLHKEQQLSSRQSDHSCQQQLHVECERRTDPEEEIPHTIHNNLVYKNLTTNSTPVNKPIPLDKPKPVEVSKPLISLKKPNAIPHSESRLGQTKGPIIKEPAYIQQRLHQNPIIKSPTKNKHTRQKKHKLIFDVNSFQLNQNDDRKNTSPYEFDVDEISAMFTTSSKMTPSVRQHSQASEMSIDDDERIRRFGDAYNAIMLAHEVNRAKPPVPRPSYSGKRWTRDPNIASALSIDGRSYSDLQRTPTLSLKQMMTSPDVYDSNKGMLNVKLHDREASWLVHMPKSSLKSPTENEKEREFVQTKQLSIIQEKDISSPDRSIKTPIADKVASLTPCLKKLNDIETKIQAIENSQKFDLEENRRAIVQAGLPSRQRSVGQRDSPTISPFVQKSFKHLTIDKGQNDTTIVQPHQDNTAKVKTSNETTTMDGNGMNPDIDNTPIVRTSTLRLLFSGVAEGKRQDIAMSETKDSSSHKQHKSTSSEGRSSKHTKSGRFDNDKHSLRQQQSSLGDDHNVNRIEGGQMDASNSLSRLQLSVQKPDEISFDDAKEVRSDDTESGAPRNRHEPEFPSSSGEHTLNHGKVSQKDMNASSWLGQDENGFVNDTDTISLRPDPSVLKPDPPDSVKSRPKEPPSSEIEHLLPQVNVANIVRASLVVHDHSFIDTDENLDDFDDEAENAISRSMMMSPSLITKRYQQALVAIEAKNWQQVSYLTHANPWLMEMKDVRNDQHLVHSLALYGGGEGDGDDTSTEQLEQLVLSIIDYDAGVVHKLDTEGYLPLHMAAASGNIMMIKVLGEKFPAAASVQNHDGLLPLHLAVMSCALYSTGEYAVDLLLNLFPVAVVIKDNDGNTPLHTAAGALRGGIGFNIISRLLRVHEDILSRNPHFFKSMSQPKIPKHFDDASVVTLETEADDTSTDCFISMMKNNSGETPLIRAIKSKAGRQVVEALLGAAGGSLAALDGNSSYATALHLILRDEFYDPAVALSILKSAPSTAAIRDTRQQLPIELACSNSLQREIILAIAIIDLPIDLGAKDDVILREGFGASWLFLLRDSNDEYVDIVTEILALCSHPQKMALCLTMAGSGSEETAVASASPECKVALRKSLRFLSRFEFTGGDQNNLVSSQHVQQFEAIDYASNEEKKVSLLCYGSNELYLKEAKHLQDMDRRFFEELEHLAIGDEDIPSGVKLRHCVSVTKSKLSLSRVVAGMPRNHKYRADLNLLRRYFSKVKSIVFCVGEGISKLHARNIVHGKIDSHSIMKFSERWKITGLCGSVVSGGCFSPTRVGHHSPPEAFFVSQSATSSAAMNPTFIAEPSVDVWAFGKLVYETFVGESMFAPLIESDDEQLQVRCIAGWNSDHAKILMNRLTESGIGKKGADLVCYCLKLKRDRPQSMDSILRHEFWKEKY
ncbi:hypothetical protein ACHAWC_011713 [Mediolabrus comicus]